MDRRFGGPLPRQLPNPTRVHLIPPEFFTLCHAALCAYAVLAVISNCYPPVWGRLPTRYSPVRHSVTKKINPKKSILSASFDLHVLSTPPAFILSQDQTLNKNFVFVFAVFVECTCKHARSPHYSRKLILIQFKINILANLSLLLFYKVSSLNACFRKTKFSGRYSSFLESFKVVSLFNYQGSLLFRTSVCYHKFRFLSTTFFHWLTEKEGFEPSRRY